MGLLKFYPRELFLMVDYQKAKDHTNKTNVCHIHLKGSIKTK